MTKALFLLSALISQWCGAFNMRSMRSFSVNAVSVQGTGQHIISRRQERNPSVTDSIDDVKQFANTNNAALKIIKRAVLPAVLFSAFFLLQQPPAIAAVQTLTQTINQKIASSGFIQAFLLIFVSEIGDKTFFIAGLLAAKYNKFISFTGSIGALAVMTILCTILGQIFHAVPASISQGIPFDDYIAVAAFAYFGLKTLKDSYDLDPSDSSGIEEEREEAEKSVAGMTSDEKRKSTISLLLQTFSLVFAAEIGDKSFLSTIALAAAQNPVSVATGAIAAHASATGIAVIGGSILTKYLSEKTIGYIGGALFLLFAVTTAIGVF